MIVNPTIKSLCFYILKYKMQKFSSYSSKNKRYKMKIVNSIVLSIVMFSTTVCCADEFRVNKNDPNPANQAFTFYSDTTGYTVTVYDHCKDGTPSGAVCITFQDPDDGACNMDLPPGISQSFKTGKNHITIRASNNTTRNPTGISCGTAEISK